MGGPRASTLRQIQRGQICALCHVFLSPPLGERVCEHCTPTVQRKPPASARIHCVFMRYHLIDGVWLVDYVQRDMRTAIGRQRRILNSEKLRDLAQRGAEDKDLASMEALAYGIAHGRGGLWCLLTDEQLAALKR